MKAVKIYPSSPISLPKGSKKFATYVRILLSPIWTFANNHIIIPAGAATLIALPKYK